MHFPTLPESVLYIVVIQALPLDGSSCFILIQAKDLEELLIRLLKNAKIFKHILHCRARDVPIPILGSHDLQNEAIWISVYIRYLPRGLNIRLLQG